MDETIRLHHLVIQAHEQGLTPKDIAEKYEQPIGHIEDLFSELGFGIKEKTEKGKRVKLCDINASMVGESVVCDVQVLGKQEQKALAERFKFWCARCDGEIEVDVRDLAKPPVNLNRESLLFASPKNLSLNLKFAGVVFLRDVHTCSQEPTVNYETAKYTDYNILYVRDLPENIDKMMEVVQTQRRVHILESELPRSTKVTLRGKVIVEDKTRDLSILANEIVPLENDITSFALTPEDRDNFTTYFNPELDISNQTAPDMVGRKLVQRSRLLVLHSVSEIPDVEGKVIRAALHELNLGDTKTHKSESIKDIIFGLKLGEWFSAETGSRTGLAYAIDSEKMLLIWGTLVLNDQGYVGIDGLQKLGRNDMEQLREVLEQQRITVRRLVRGDANARDRISAAMNPNKDSLEDYVYRCESLKDTKVFQDNPDLTRWDIFLTYAGSDVSLDEITHRTTADRPVPEGIFRRHILWAWSRKPENIRYRREAKELIKKESTRIGNTYGCPSLPIVHSGVRDIICRLSVAQASKEHSVDATHENIIVDVGQVERAVGFYEETLEALELLEYKLEKEGKLEITESDIYRMTTTLEEDHLRLLDCLAGGSKTAVELAEVLDCAIPTIHRRYVALRGEDLIRTGPKGATLTTRGVRFVRRIRENRLGKGGLINLSRNDKVEPLDNFDSRLDLSKNDKLITPKSPGMISQTDVICILKEAIADSDLKTEREQIDYMRGQGVFDPEKWIGYFAEQRAIIQTKKGEPWKVAK